MKKKDLIEIGWEEWVALPELHLPAIKAKVDTGAKTSALHAFMVERFEEEGQAKVRFGIHPIPSQREIEVYCIADLIEERKITSSNQQTELRYVIRTMAKFGKDSWPIDITLTNRDEMSSRMLIGRSAMVGRLVVRPEASFLLGELSASAYEPLITAEKERSLSICILSREAGSYSTQKLKLAAELRGHHVKVVDVTKCSFCLSNSDHSIRYQGRVLEKFDVVIPRIGASITSYGLAILRQFESMGVFILNSSHSIAYSRDKLYAHQLLTRGKVAMPITAFGRSMDDTNDIINLVKGAPLIIKLLQGSQGESVVLAETNKAAKAVIQAFRGVKADCIVQEYINESAGSDIRVIVLGNKVIAAMERRSEEGDFRSNLHQGGKAYRIKVTKEERELVIKAARILGLKFTGVDLLRSSSGPKIIELNSSPGLAGIESLTRINIAAKVIEYIEKNARPRLLRVVIQHGH